jgi:hypothetical protein
MLGAGLILADQATPVLLVMLGQTATLIPVPLEPTATPVILETQEVLVLTCQIL